MANGSFVETRARHLTWRGGMRLGPSHWAEWALAGRPLRPDRDRNTLPNERAWSAHGGWF